MKLLPPLLPPRVLLAELKKLPRRIERGSLAVQQFTAVFPLQGGTTGPLRDFLAALDDNKKKPSPYQAVPGIHGLRWILLDQVDEGTAPDVSVAVSSGPLVLSIVFDGNVDDVLAGLVERTPKELADILRHSADFPGIDPPEDCISYLKKARVKGGYLFVDDEHQASRAEIEESLQLQREFAQFFAKHQATDDVRVLRERFTETFCRREGGDAPPVSARVPVERQAAAVGLGYPFPLSRFEKLAEDEGRWIRRVVELTRRLQESDVRRKKNDEPRRVAHTKHHGLIDATFTVRDDLDPAYKVGIFREKKEFAARLRVSNTSNFPRADLIPDGRGLAIKLLDVRGHGDPVLHPPLPDGTPDAQLTQDFLMISHPTFFMRDIGEFALLRSILDIGTFPERALRGFVFAIKRRKQVGILLKTLLRIVAHPLAAEFHSTTPSLLGNRMVKYSVRPKNPKQLAYLRPNWRDPNYLRAALQKSLLPGSPSIELELCIHVLPDHVLSAEPDPTVYCEDPTIDWGKAGAKRIPVATIVINPHDATSDERMKVGERMRFTPWHTLAQHRPLGSLNRARLFIYRASAAGRAEPVEVPRSDDGDPESTPIASGEN